MKDSQDQTFQSERKNTDKSLNAEREKTNRSLIQAKGKAETQTDNITDQGRKLKGNAVKNRVEDDHTKAERKRSDVAMEQERSRVDIAIVREREVKSSIETTILSQERAY